MQKVDGISEQLDFFRHFSVKDKKYPVQFKTVRDILRQHRAIVSASRSRLFAPHLQFEKREIHTVFLRFPNFELSQKSRLGLLAKLCGVALILIRKASPDGAACFVIYKERNHKTSLI